MHHYRFFPRKERNCPCCIVALDPTVGRLGDWEPVRGVGRPPAGFMNKGKEKPKAGKARSNGHQPRCGFLSVPSLYCRRHFSCAYCRTLGQVLFATCKIRPGVTDSPMQCSVGVDGRDVGVNTRRLCSHEALTVLYNESPRTQRGSKHTRPKVQLMNRRCDVEDDT
jgi:hypothetical protein